MGLLTTMGSDLVSDVKDIAARERKRYEDLKKKQAEDAASYELRSKSMQGAGRSGLMYGGNAQGV